MILDVDGTLVDSNDAHAHAWVAAFASQGVTVAFDRVRRAIGMGGDKLMPAVSGLSDDSPLGKKIAEQRGRIFAEQFLPRLRPFPGTRALIERFLADGLTLAVASSAKRDELQPLLEVAGVADLVRLRTSSDDAEQSKPEPDIVHAALGRAKSDPARTIMIGDTPYDVEAALRAGIRIVGFRSGGWEDPELAGASEVYEGPEDLLTRYESSAFADLTRVPAEKGS